jgi:hypothetical protein
MAGAEKKLQPDIADDNIACHIMPVQPERGDDAMADDAVMEILKRIQASIAAMDEKFTTQLAAMDEKFTRQNIVLAQDVRFIRGGIQDMARTRVTAGEVDVLHEDLSKLELGLTALTIRVEALEHAKQ